ncbi:probable ubiquitin-conjugating enzyme E2 23 [Cucurbita pepo subsp. pepo]|uniref:probable ubiquitin-conjugating enzyme E2 23 n=1 Tax=Cucurbita pepo subsp. pepo TaxID=3664 RepID=UPI000C9D9B8F|nr:probable ubiquitin-conjugating enzyme E2 23 [Cucurbita pepo subsp. pepo]
MEQQGSVDKESLIGTGNSYTNRDGVSSSENVHMTTINNDETRRTNENTSDKPSIPHIYRQDIVKSKGSGMIGIVTEVAGDADSDSDITDDEDEDEDEDGEDGEDDDGCDDDDGDGEKVGQNKENYGDDSNAKNSNRDNYKSQPLPDDEVRVLWMDESETTLNVNDLTVIDRGFLHGDFVAAVSDPTGQAGVVVDVNISVDLLVPDGSIMKDISSKDLKRVRDFTVGDYVVLGPWLGRIDDVLDNVTVMFDDGSKCKVTKAEPMRLKPVSKNILEDANFPYYPGQRVKASSSTVFKNSKWLSGLWKPNRLEGTVTKVAVGSVFIYWIASAGYGPDSSTTPAEEQTPKNLRLLTCFSHANWQLGDWCLLPSSFSSGLTKESSRTHRSDSVNNSLDSTQPEGVCDSEDVVLNELSGTTESTDLDSLSACDGNYRNPECNILPESSNSRALKETTHETWPLHRKKIRKVVIRRDKKARKKEENFERALLIINTKTKVDVAWQDGRTERGLDSTTLIPIDNPGDHEFVPEQYVVEKASDNDDDISESRRVGVVKSVHAKERTACVMWLKPVSRAEDPREFDIQEIVSVYELEGHPDYDYCYGDVVVRLSPVSESIESMSLGNDTEELKQQSSTNEMTNCTEKASGSQKIEDPSCSDDCIDFSDLSWVGNITGLKNGDIEVTWANGMVSTVGPQAIYVVGRDDDDESIAAGSEVSNGAASWETVDDDDERDSVDNAKEDIELQDTGVNSEEEGIEQNNSGRNLALSVPFAAIRFFTRLAAGIFSRGPRNPESMDVDSHSESETQSLEIQALEEKDSGLQSSSLKSNSFDASDMNSDCGRGEDNIASEPSEVSESADASSNLRTAESDGSACHEDGTCSFKGFDIAKDPLDHYFLGTNGQTNNGRKWLKKIQQDWSILQNNLPDGIYVRVYEDRMDLLRAVIVGAYGTPYQDGLFFFDFHLPPEYPDVPPSAYYHSGGWRINPNLYEEGKVCLSLLNTWTGRGNEVWDSKSSSILQVLVSLQGLVLNSKPYFNEAGYDKQIGTAEGEKNSLSYNENTFLLNCKTIMYLMRKPPKDFEELVKEHFRRRGYFILKACDAYMKGHLIGSLTEDASIRENSDPNSTSVGFKLMLAKIVPKLVSSLNEVGADCDDFKHFQQL